MTHEPPVADALDSRPAFSGDSHPAEDDPRPRPVPAWLAEATADVERIRGEASPHPVEADASDIALTPPGLAGPV
jgi:hypothetical protein